MRIKTATFIAAVITAIASAAPAVTVTLDFSSQATGCETGATLASGLTIIQGHCHDRNSGDFQDMTAGDSFIIQANPGVTFDFIGADILFFWEETFALPVADVPAGLDLTDPNDIDVINQNWLWQDGSFILPLLHVLGSANGATILDWSAPLLDTESYLASIGQTPPFSDLDWDPRAFPGSPASGLDRLEIRFGTLLAGATIQTPRLIGDTWFAGMGGHTFVFDDLELEVTQPNTPTPTPPPVSPVPLPASVLSLLFGILLLWRRKNPWA